jgi:hypothetical protein
MWREFPTSQGAQEASGLAPEVDGGRSEGSTADEAGPPTNLVCLQLVFEFSFVLF